MEVCPFLKLLLRLYYVCHLLIGLKLDTIIRFLSVDNNPGYLEDIRQMVEAGKTGFSYISSATDMKCLL